MTAKVIKKSSRKKIVRVSSNSLLGEFLVAKYSGLLKTSSKSKKSNSMSTDRDIFMY